MKIQCWREASNSSVDPDRENGKGPANEADKRSRLSQINLFLHLLLLHSFVIYSLMNNFISINIKSLRTWVKLGLNLLTPSSTVKHKISDRETSHEDNFPFSYQY